jgi:type I restriction enzyme S subunit
MIKEEIFNLFSNVQIGYLVDSDKVVSGDTRLDSSHFIEDVSYTLNSKIKFTTLSEFINDVEEPALFTRIYCDKEFGIPYISSSEISEIEPPVDSRFISKNLTNNIEQYIIKRGQILVSAAGTVGSIVVATEELDGVAGTSDILRINLDETKYLGFIYTYLTSSFGANELSNLAYGAIIKRVRGFQLAQLKTPIINDSLIEKINQFIVKALENRDQANRLIKKARSLVLQYNNLPTLSTIKPKTLDVDGEVEMRMTGLDEFTQDYRLDAHFYNPTVKQLLDNIKEFAQEYCELGDGFAERIFYLNRFTRIFVEKGFGIPYMAGKDIIKIRPTDVAYLSYSETSGLEDYSLKTGWILMTCSGTLARTCYIYKNYEDWVATHDLIRIVPSGDFDSGYLYAFLSTEYGYRQAIKFKHGAVIDHLTPEQVKQILIPLPFKKQQKEIGDLIRQAYELRAEAIRLEDEAQELLTQALTQA